ncbi:MAG TPA: hypothetical protein VL551_34205 [Actinospica sp.]|jgi:hypothetical protein|nr:hypothetical protein [Actinospica sp.]
MIPQIQPLTALIGALRARAAAAFADENRSKGASAIEWVIITAVAATLAIAVGVIITRLVTDKANSISTS